MKQYNSIQMFPDADPLAMPAGGVPMPQFPLLMEKPYRLIIRSPQIQEYGEPKYKYLTFKLETTTEAQTTEGKTMHPGFKFGVMEVAEQATSAGKTEPWRTLEDVAARLSVILRAVLGAKTTVTARQLIDNPSMLADKPVDAKVTISKAKGDREPQNEVKIQNWIVPGV